MRFYGIQPTELAQLTEAQRRGLQLNIERIQARESLTFILNVTHVFPGEDGHNNPYIKTLIGQAFVDDPRTHAIALEAMTRRDIRGWRR